MSHLMRRSRSVFLICAAALSYGFVPAAAQEAADDCPGCEEGAALVSRFGLREAPTPVRERPGWSPPRRIVTILGEPMAERLRRIAPDAEVIGVPNAGAAAEVVQGADVYVGPCTPQIVQAGTELKWIQLPSAGAESCAGLPGVAERGILVTNTQRIYGPQIAEHVMAMVLSFARRLYLYGAAQRAGSWSEALMSIRKAGFWELDGKTMLVVGLGGLGTEVARRANALGMRVTATRNSRREGPDFVEYVGLADELSELAAQADVVVNTTPLTPDTRGLFDADFFASMKPTAYFINVGRGKSVVTADLVAALEAGRIAGAGLDVTDPEPLPPGHPLWSLPDVILTPHVAAGSDFFIQRLETMITENVRRYVAGGPMLSVVDLERGY